MPSRALYFGGGTGFWSDTVASLIESTLYAQPYALSALGPLTVAVAVTLIAATGIAFTGAARAVPGSSREAALAMLGLLIACVASSQLQHQLLGTKFLLDRTALFLLPIFTLFVVFSCDALDGNPLLRRTGSIAAAVFAALVTLHTAAALNTSHTLTWPYDADTRRMLNDLAEFVTGDARSAAHAQPGRRMASPACGRLLPRPQRPRLARADDPPRIRPHARFLLPPAGFHRSGNRTDPDATAEAIPAERARPLARPARLRVDRTVRRMMERMAQTEIATGPKAKAGRPDWLRRAALSPSSRLRSR